MIFKVSDPLKLADDDVQVARFMAFHIHKL